MRARYVVGSIILGLVFSARPGIAWSAPAAGATAARPEAVNSAGTPGSSAAAAGAANANSANPANANLGNPANANLSPGAERPRFSATSESAATPSAPGTDASVPAAVAVEPGAENAPAARSATPSLAPLSPDLFDAQADADVDAARGKPARRRGRDARNPRNARDARPTVVAPQAPAGGVANDTGGWTIRAAIQTALNYSPTVKTAQGRVDEANARVWGSYSKLLLNVNAALTASERKDSLATAASIALNTTPAFGGEPYNYYDFALTATQPLINIGIFYGVGVVGRDLELRKLDLQIAKRDLELQVVQAFYTFLLNESRLNSARDQEKVLRELQGLVGERARVGRSRRIEVLQIRARLAAVQPQITAAQVNFQVSAAQLANLLGLRDERRIRVVGTLRPLDFARIERLLSDKRVQRLELDRARVALDQVSDNRAATLSQNLPSLSAFGNWGRASAVKSDLFDQDFTAWSFGLRLDIPIFSGLSSIADRYVYAAQERQFQFDEARIRDQLDLEQVQTERQLQAARTEIESAVTSLDVSTEALRIARSDYRLGAADYLQLSQSETDFVNAQTVYEGAQYDYLNNVARLFVASGWNLDELVDLLENGNAQRATPAAGAR